MSKDFISIFKVYLIWIFSLFIIIFVGFYNFPRYYVSKGFLESFANWDGGHYLGIAEFGYSEKFQYAFFPLYPLLIKFFENILGSYLLSGIFINIVCAVLGIYIFYLLVSLEFNKKIGMKAVLGLLVFPTSFYLLVVYSESLFFLLTILSFFFLKQSEKKQNEGFNQKLLLATIFSALACATRVVGVAVAVAIIFYVIKYRKFHFKKFNLKNVYVLLSFLGLLIYGGYLLKVTGDPFYFVTAQLHWERFLTSPIEAFRYSLLKLSLPYSIFDRVNILLNLVFTVFGLGIILRSFRFLKIHYCIYSLVAILLPLLTPTLNSIPRYLLIIFPIFMLIAIQKTKVFIAYCIVSSIFLIYFVILFMNGYWVS